VGGVLFVCLVKEKILIQTGKTVPKQVRRYPYMLAFLVINKLGAPSGEISKYNDMFLI